MPGLILTTPPKSSTSTPRRRSSEPTNTLILTSLPPAFFHPSVLGPLREHFASYGEIMSWAPLKAFGRVIVSFWNVDDAERLREETDYLKIGDDESSQVTLRLYRGEPTPYPSATTDNHLHVPAQTKNFLISPPGSPPVGWEPVEEEPPNTASLAADLVAALTRLQLSQGREREGGKEVLMRPGDDGEGLAVFLEDCDSDGGWRQGSRTPDEVVEVLSAFHEDSDARRPRSEIHHVKATVASMGVAGGFVPTSMPPRPTVA